MEMVGTSDTMETLAYLKGPLHDVSGSDATDIKHLTAQIIRSTVFEETETWRARLRVFEEISNIVDRRYAQPQESVGGLLPLQ